MIGAYPIGQVPIGTSTPATSSSSGTVLVDFAYSYAVLAPVTVDFAGAYNILQSVAADAGFAYAVRAAVVKDFAFSYQVQGDGIPSEGAAIDISVISPARIVVFEGSGSRVIVFGGSGPRVRISQMSVKVPTFDGTKWLCDRDQDEESHYAADITQELADRNTTAVSVELVLVGVAQLEEPDIQVATISGVQRTFVVAFLGGVEGEPPAGWKWVARVRCANGERFDKTTWFNKVDP